MPIGRVCQQQVENQQENALDADPAPPAPDSDAAKTQRVQPVMMPRSDR